MAVGIEEGPSFAAGTPQPLFVARSSPMTTRVRFRPSPDGQRFLVNVPGSGDATARPAVVVLNWASALEGATR